jgi:glyoxylase-like metal-dependent hydrolase (beta-lactamase superfamily II)
MEIHTFVLGSFQVSAYVVVEGGEAMAVDAPEGSEQTVEFCRGRGLAPKLLVNTHGHADHIFANAALKAAWPDLRIAIGQEDGPMLTSPMRNLSLLMGAWIKSPKADRLLVDGDKIELGPATFEVLATPGHTRGGISLYTASGPNGDPVVFTGDALFAEGVGRTDFPGASYETLLTSIRQRLLTLPPETVVYPGHGPETTIGHEASANPWL